MRVVGYARVSTERQVEAFGLAVQEDQLRAWARAGGHRLVAIARDEGVSGSSPPDERPGLVDAIAHLRDGRAAAIVVPRLDRLARDLVMQEQLLSEIRRAGGELRSTSAGEDHSLQDTPDDPTRALIRHVLGAVAQYERSMIRLRMRSGKRRKAEAGGYAGGRPPYGYRARGRELEEDPAEQEVVAVIVALRNVEGTSLRDVAGELDRRGYRQRNGRPWSPETVRNVLLRAGEMAPTRRDQRRGAGQRVT